jgi:predicted Holliday junction resolvase-like endonuclease
LDIFLSICFIGGLAIWLYSQYYNPEDSIAQTEVDKLLEREQNKEIFHAEQVNNLQHEINLLKNQSTELNILNNNLEKAYSDLEKDYIKNKNDLENQIFEISEQKKKVTSQKKSSEVRLGHIAETLAPFLDQFDFDPETCVFLGRPIDYISFGDDEITFIEVKSGQSQLNAKQRYIRDQVKAKLVTWKEVRIK